MKKIETPLPGLFIIEPLVFEDNRGYFYESWHKEKYADVGLDINFVQDNESRSVRGVIRGLHYQLYPCAQAKLVRVVSGAVYDVALDIRKNSPTFMKWFGVELSSNNKKQLFIPHGFAHGFSVLSETAIFSYKCDNPYSKEHERAIHFNDPLLNIDWHIDKSEQMVSDRDKLAPLFREAEMNF